MKEAADGVVTALATAWAALADGEWTVARRAFEEAVRAEETPEALEGLSWAAWWLDDADTVFDARERSYLLYRRQADSASAARMAVWLASDNLDFRGAMAAAGGWLRRARRLLEPLPTGPEHGWLAFHEGYIAHLSGNSSRAGRLADEAAEAGRRFEVPDLEMLGLALAGAVLVTSTKVEEGMRYLDEATATALAGEATIPISSAWTCCFLVGTCAAVLDFERAFEWCDRIAEFAERYGSRYMLAFCRAEYGAVYLWRGQWTDAEAMLEASIEDFSTSRPAMVDGPLVALAELRRRQGREEEAVTLLDRAAPSAAAQLCRSRLALDRGDGRLATDLVERLLRQSSTGMTLDLVPVLEHLVAVRLAQGDVDGARAALDSLREIGRLVATEPLLAAAERAEGLIEAAQGNHERARTLLEDAVDRYQRIGAPFEASQARIGLAKSLAAVGRIGPARREASAALDCLLELGARPEAERAKRLLDPGLGNEGRVSRPGVTSREREVLALVAEGLTNRQIAGRLVVSEHTIHRHVTNILRKLNLPSRAAAAAYAVRAGVVEETDA